jgi:hypothetical protein
MLTTFQLNSNWAFSSAAVQTAETSVVAVSPHVRFVPWQVDLRNVVADDALVFQDAPVSK